MMLIGIDGNEANQKVRVGSGVYAFELLKQFEKSQISNLKFQIFLKDLPLFDLPKESSRWKYIVVKPRNLWTQVGLPLELWKSKLLGKAPDVFFSPSHYAPRFCPVPSVITVYDLSFIRFPEMFVKKDLYQLKDWTEYSVRQAKKIITISEFSKNEIANHYGIQPDKIEVAYPGYDKNKYQKSQPKADRPRAEKIKNQRYILNIKNKYKIDSEYILYIGTVQPRKNLVRLIEAFAQVFEKNQKMKLVICGMMKEGRGGWMQEEILEKIKNQKSKIKNNVIITGFVAEDYLPYLIAGAKVLVLPSLYEGFGIPAVEAMASGIPVVVSNTSSLPEIVGEAGFFVDPYSIKSIEEGLSEACYNDSKREKLVKKGLKQVEKFNWEKSAKTILGNLINL